MKISMIQMDVRFAEPDCNFEHAAEMVRRAVQERPDGAKPDVVTLPETFNVGFFPRENLQGLSDKDGQRTKQVFSALAKELDVNIIAGSVANLKEGGVYNTCHIFNRSGGVAATYDKTHLFSPMDEHKYFSKGQRLTTFELDGVSCGIVICYDIRFVELVRALALKTIDVLFVVAQWPKVRLPHWQTLNRARAIENQMFVCCTNSCAVAGEVKYGGHSSLINPWGEVLAEGGEEEEIVHGELDLSIVKGIRESINVYRDRRPDLY